MCVLHACVKNPAVREKFVYLMRDDWVCAIALPVQSPSSPPSSTALVNPREGLL